MWAFLIIWFALGPVGVLFALAAIPIATYGLLTRVPHRGARASRTALVLSLLAALASALLWVTMLSDEPKDYQDSDIGIYKVIAIIEVFALVLTLLSALRQQLRRKPGVQS